jgi:hypothetical protein
MRDCISITVKIQRPIKENKIGGASSTHGRDDRKPEGKKQLGEIYA